MYLDGQPDRALFGVFDGHGGAEVARFCAQHLPDVFLSSEGYKKGDITAALVSSYLEIDEMLRDPANAEELDSLKATPSEQTRGVASGLLPRKSTCPDLKAVFVCW
jgi:protein phosphatase 1G